MSRTRAAVLAVAGVLLALFGGRWIAVRYTEVLWYADVGQGSPFRGLLAGRLLWQVLAFLGGSLWYGLQVAGVYLSIGSVHLPRRIGNLEIAEAVPRRVLLGIAAGVALGLGLLTAFTFHDLADYVTLYRAAVPFGLPEPVLGRDASFYVAQLPLLETLLLMAAIAVVVAIVLVGGLYALTDSLVIRRHHSAVTPHARAHLVVLLAVLALVVAWGFQIDAYQLVGGGGSDGGALTAVDRSLRIPASTALAALGLVVAALTVLFLRWGGLGGLIGIWATFALIAVVGRYVAPVVDQAWGLRPERTVALALGDIGDRYARAGMGVAGLRPVALAATATAPDDSLDRLGNSLAGFSPWSADPALLAGWLDALTADSARPRLWTVTPTAHQAPGGGPRLLALAVPETDALALFRARERPPWTAAHRGPLAWGGPALSLALSDGGAWRPDTVPLPPVRYLAHEAELAVVGEDGRAPGEEPSGVRLEGYARRLLLAWALQSPPLLGNRTSAGDRLLYWRDVPQRMARLYPFATFASARGALVEGRLVWIAAGFLASDRFPLAEQVAWQGQMVNYLRAPYVATVDAGNGRTRLYLRGEDTAFAARLARLSGANTLPADSIPAALRPHLGYPASLFAVEAAVLAKHHGEPGQPAWVVARQPVGDEPDSDGQERWPPAVQVLLPLQGAWEQWRLLPLADGGGNRLVAFAAARESGEGPMVPHLFRLSSADFPTIAAAESRLNATPAVVGAVAAAAGPDGAVRRSAVVALPAAGTVVYAQVIFASPKRLAEPLRPAGVVLMAGGRVGVGADVASAARALASARVPAGGEALTDLGLEKARAAYLSLDSAARRGDWPAFGRAMETLRRSLGLGTAPKP